jgi:DNA-directed RNA polymerase specialized sigma24 family protein
MSKKQPKKDPPRPAAPPEPQREPPRFSSPRESGEPAPSHEELIDGCLDGDERAWAELYRRFHPRLIETIGFLLGQEAQRLQLVDEIAARVWYALVRDDAKLLARFDAGRSGRLDAFMMGLARIEIMRYLRAERRRRSHEVAGGRRILEEHRISDFQVGSLMEEFAATLTPGEREFMEKFLIANIGPEDVELDELPPTSVWQRRHRIRFKLGEFFRDQ